MTEAEHCHKLIAMFYEREPLDMGGGLTIVELPSWMDVKDVDLIKKALKRLASGDNGP